MLRDFLDAVTYHCLVIYWCVANWKEIDSLMLVEEEILRIKQHNPKTNVVIMVASDNLHSAAR